MSVDDATREELINEYFEMLDTEDFDQLESVFTEDVTYLYSLDQEIKGIDDLRAFFEGGREVENSIHEAVLFVHDAERTACELHDEFDLPDGSHEQNEWVDIFEFDEETERISCVKVFKRVSF